VDGLEQAVAHHSGAVGGDGDLRAPWDTLCRRLIATWGEALKTPLALRLCMVQALDHAQWREHLEDASCCFEFRVRDRRSWLALSPAVALAMVERLLGSPPAADASSRAATSLERRVLGRLVEAAGAALESCLGAPAESPGPAPELTVATFTAEFDARRGALRVAVPRELAPLGERQRQGAPMELTLSLPETTLAAQDAMALAPGDIVATDLPPGGEVIVRVAGIPKFAGLLCEYQGRRAVRILRRLG
jgi:flagellar motor switch protein FliM